MFVDIEDYKSPLKVEIILTPYKRGRLASDKKSYLPKEPITPDICWEVLRSTNAPRNIKDMLQCIADLPPSEQAQFKDVVLSTFTQREQSDKKNCNIVLLGEKLAVASGYEKELADARKIKEGKFLRSTSELNQVYVYFEDFVHGDFSAYNRLTCASFGNVYFSKSCVLPEYVDVPFAQKVHMKECNFIQVKKVNFKSGAKVHFEDAQNLPPLLDVSRCSYVNFKNCDLNALKNLCFAKNAEVFLHNSNLPENVDFSTCAELYLQGCDLKGQSHLRFKEGANVFLTFSHNLPDNIDCSKCASVDMAYVSNLPKNLNVAECSKVTLSGVDLRKQYNLHFKEGADVNLHGAYLPFALDVSPCGKLDLGKCDLSGLKKIVFKNRQQLEDSSLKFPQDWKGKLFFEEDLPHNNIRTYPPQLVQKIRVR